MNGKLQIIKGSLEVDLEKEDEELHSRAEYGGKGRKKREKSEKWVPEETEKFYKALQIFGTDFSIISKLLPGRSRKQIKNKFNREERENPEKIDLILKQGNTCTLEDFQKCYGPVDDLLKETEKEDDYIKDKILARLGTDKGIPPHETKQAKINLLVADPTI